MRSWRDEHDARLSLTRANLRSQNDLTAQLKSRRPRLLKIAYFGSKKSAWMRVPPTFSVACSVASIHIDVPVDMSRSAVSPEGSVNVTLPSESKSSERRPPDPGPPER